MRRVRYQVACSVDGCIAGPNGEYDWIVTDPDIDFKALFAQFDTLLMGRKTYQAAAANAGMFGGMETYVFSRTLPAGSKRGVTVVRENAAETVAELKARPGKDIWLFGGGELFRSLLEAGLVDTVEPAVIPVLVGGGIPFLPATTIRTSLTLTKHRVFPKSGIALLEYAVSRDAGGGKPGSEAKTRGGRKKA
jgi:dihydrofolate reductase